MKRSEVNGILREGAAFIRSFGYEMPPFASWSPEILRQRHPSGMLQARLGWDVTDFGQDRFSEIGLLLFTVRNGRLADLEKQRGMLYAEKIMVTRRDQLTPLHRHLVKAEDIINRGGGRLVIQVYGMGPNGDPDEATPVVLMRDGQAGPVAAGGKISLGRGESVTLLPGVWHSFWAEERDVLVGEVSTVNDDLTDNVFVGPVGRFSSIEEDEEPLHLLVSDYDSIR